MNKENKNVLKGNENWLLKFDVLENIEIGKENL
jgi:hypothetical protein